MNFKQLKASKSTEKHFKKKITFLPSKNPCKFCHYLDGNYFDQDNQ